MKYRMSLGSKDTEAVPRFVSLKYCPLMGHENEWRDLWHGVSILCQLWSCARWQFLDYSVSLRKIYTLQTSPV